MDNTEDYAFGGVDAPEKAVGPAANLVTAIIQTQNGSALTLAHGLLRQWI